MSKFCLHDGLMMRLAPPTIADVISPACRALQAMSRHVRDDEHAVLSVMLRFLSATIHSLRVLAPGGLQGLTHLGPLKSYSYETLFASR